MCPSSSSSSSSNSIVENTLFLCAKHAQRVPRVCERILICAHELIMVVATRVYLGVRACASTYTLTRHRRWSGCRTEHTISSSTMLQSSARRHAVSSVQILMKAHATSIIYVVVPMLSCICVSHARIWQEYRRLWMHTYVTRKLFFFLHSTLWCCTRNNTPHYDCLCLTLPYTFRVLALAAICLLLCERTFDVLGKLAFWIKSTMMACRREAE